MLSTMARVQVIGSRRVLDLVVRKLHDLGVVQIEDAASRLDSTETFLHKGIPDSPEASRLEALLGRIAGVLAVLPSTEGHASAPLDLALDLRHAARSGTETAGDVMSPSQPTARPDRSVAHGEPLPRPSGKNRVVTSLEDLLADLEAACAGAGTRNAALEAEAAALRQYQTVVTHLSGLIEGPVKLQGFETTALVVRERHRVALDLIASELDGITHGRCEVISADVGTDSAVALVIYDRRSAQAVHALLHGEGLSEVDLPAEYVGMPFAEVRDAAQTRAASIATELAEIAELLRCQSAAYRASLLAAQSELADRLDELAVESSMAESEHVFVLQGWVPRRQIGRLRAALAAVSPATEVLELAVGDDELSGAPVLFENWPIVRPFELLMNVLSPPRYGTIDPTPLMAVFFPLFFGMILGDVAYGVILLIASVVIIRRPGIPRWLDQLARIMLICSFPTIAFGVAYGELFGGLAEPLGMQPLLVDRMSAFVPVLAFSIAVGCLQVVLGLILGMVNGYLEHHRRAILDKAALLVALIALFSVVGAAADLLPRDVLTPGIAALVVTVVVLIASMGIVGPLEVVGAVGNVLSYSRLMAIGLSSVVLAEVGNELAGLTGSLLLGVIVAGLFHSLNVALGVFSPTIQSMRLHYVEFFGKFYESGGDRFHPFRRGDATRLKVA